MLDILQALIETIGEKRPCVFCSVVETRGSTPQKAGASMIVFPDGGQRGTLGGGCVEAEVRQKALHVLTGSESRPEILTFSLDDDYGWDDGLICGGRMKILAEPLQPASKSFRTEQQHSYFQRLLDLAKQGKGCQEALVINEQAKLSVGNRFLFDAGQNLAAQVGDGQPTSSLTAHLMSLNPRSAPLSHQGIAYLPLWPRITLLIVGGGHVGQAVAHLAAQVDFDVWVLDDREAFVSAERFPSAQKRLVGDIGEELKKRVATEVDPTFYTLIVTRGHGHDEEALYHLAPSSAGYVGMIGSKRKIKLIFEDLIAKGIPAEALSRVHAPLGFDIGSQTVPEIAVSIVSQLIAYRNLGSVTPRARAAITPANVRT